MGIGALFAMAALIVLPAGAQANISHVFTGTFGSSSSSPVDPYPISEPTDVVVDQATGDIYVTDPGNHRVEKFDSTGHFLFMFGRNVNKTAIEESRTSEANICPAAGHAADECQPAAGGESPGAFENPMWLAVDNFAFGEGNVYVGDLGDNVVTKFNSSGQVISGWGAAGQKNGADDPNLPLFGPLFGLAVGGGCVTPEEPLTGHCSPNGTLFVGGRQYGNNVREYTQNGQWMVDTFVEGAWVRVNAAGHPFFVVSPFGTFGSKPEVWTMVPRPGSEGEGTTYQVTSDWPANGFALDPSSEEVYESVETREDEVEPHGLRIDRYSPDCNPVAGACEPIDTFGEGHLSRGKEVCIPGGYGNPFECQLRVKGVAVDGSTHTVYAVNSEAGGGEIAVFGDARPIVTTGEPTDVETSSVTLTGHVDPAGRGAITDCFFEYGFDKKYGRSVPCTPDPASSPPGSNFTAPTDVTASISGLSPGTHEHYRLVATNDAGATTNGSDRIFATTAPPAIDGLVAEHLTATSAELVAQVNPNGLRTTYRFQYGLSISYGEEVVGSIEASNTDQEITAQLTGLTPGAYHFRLVAENKVEGKEEGGTTTTEDHVFNFYPPACPNENVRQQTASNYVPDCRAYELVSPGDANGTQLYAGGPNTGLATSPPRFSYTGLWSTIPNSGGSPIDTTGDLYVATRTSTGWVTRYVGLPSSEAAVDGGPPQGLFGQGGGEFLGNNSSISNGNSGADRIQNNVLTDPGMNRFLNWSDGSQEVGSGRNENTISSNAPFVWSAHGDFLDRWPTNLASIPAGVNPYLVGGVNPGGIKSLDCPTINEAGNYCPGEVSASSDLGHFAFSTEWNVFAPGGQQTAPGSVYDNDTRTREVLLASTTPDGAAIPAEPGDNFGDPLQIPGLSSDGSHILMGSPGVGPCGLSNCPVPPCGGTFGGKIHCPTYPLHLYMRVGGAVTYDVSQGQAVTYVGMTADATKVYFTTPDQLSDEDHDASVDLYMWSEKGEAQGSPLTLVSRGNNPGNPDEPGNSDSCTGSFSTPQGSMSKNCDVITFSDLSYCQLTGGSGGNCRADTAIASENGDIYFFSPEQLDGSRGVPNQENLYDYREGELQYVATFSGGRHCFESPIPGFTDQACSATPIPRMQVSPNDTHMAFATDSPVTQYDNAGHLEMYLYDPAVRRVVCASCVPNGSPPTSDITASQDGLFMTYDGRVFFATEDALAHADTNKGQDIYEFVGGRPQLITTGTGETHAAGGAVAALLNPPGLVGVSAGGQDVFFSTYDTLVSQDHNGLFLKFYDARTGGGFSAPAAPPPCEAADECHGPDSSPPGAMQDETNASLNGGNLAQAKSPGHRKAKRHRHRRRAHRARHHRVHRSGGGAR
jgi:hypothetical protein